MAINIWCILYNHRAQKKTKRMRDEWFYCNVLLSIDDLSGAWLNASFKCFSLKRVRGPQVKWLLDILTMRLLCWRNFIFMSFEGKPAVITGNGSLVYGFRPFLDKMRCTFTLSLLSVILRNKLRGSKVNQRNMQCISYGDLTLH